MNLVIPDNNDLALPNVIKKVLSKKYKHKITGIYGKLTRNEYLGSGRTNENDYTKENALERINKFRQMGLSYEWTVNDIVPRFDFLEERPKIIEELEWIETSNIPSITISSYGMAKLAQNYCPSVDISVSFFAGVNSIKNLLQWARIPNVKVINLHRSTYRNFPLLKSLVKHANEHNVEIRVIANIGCMSDCIQTEGHAIIKSYASINSSALHCRPFTYYCMRFLLESPEEFLRLPIIRPEDLDVYDTIGVGTVKLVDRSQTTEWNKRIMEYYLNGSFDGNILDLTSNFSTFNLPQKTTKEIAELNMDKMCKSRAGIREYKKLLPALMDMKIDSSYNFLECNNSIDNCKECSKSSAIKYDKSRRAIVLEQLDRIEEYLYK